MTPTDDLYYITPMEKIVNAELGPLNSYVFRSCPTHIEVKMWLTKTGLRKLFKDLGVVWKELFGLANARSSFLISATPEQRDIIEDTLDDMTIMRSYATVQKQHARQNAERYEATQRVRYASMMAECAKIQKMYPDLIWPLPSS